MHLFYTNATFKNVKLTTASVPPPALSADTISEVSSLLIRLFIYFYLLISMFLFILKEEGGRGIER